MDISIVPLFRTNRIRTARCLLTDGDRYLLVVHAGANRHRQARWGLPGGHVDLGEAPEAAARRELAEELELRVGVLDFVADWSYKNAMHRIYTAPLPAPIERFDTRELLDIGWHTAADIERFARAGDLHAGYEHEVVRAICAPQRAAG